MAFPFEVVERRLMKLPQRHYHIHPVDQGACDTYVVRPRFGTSRYSSFLNLRLFSDHGVSRKAEVQNCPSFLHACREDVSAG